MLSITAIYSIIRNSWRDFPWKLFFSENDTNIYHRRRHLPISFPPLIPTKWTQIQAILSLLVSFRRSVWHFQRYFAISVHIWPLTLNSTTPTTPAILPFQIFFIAICNLLGWSSIAIFCQITIELSDSLKLISPFPSYSPSLHFTDLLMETMRQNQLEGILDLAPSASFYELTESCPEIDCWH